ncbi:hypothetical protein CTI14_02485 [Methylobacterium radiotolerans]|nr:hypothetical protein CTI14_02485 [Methylobacterium radiotolerans]RUP22827.1 MAG: hypothetical protein EKK44_03150 [Methylobacterium sp.]
MAKHDSRLSDDPIWYDRVEADEPAGPILTLLAHSFLLVMPGLRAAGTLYWLPTLIWGRGSGLIRRRRASAARRS